MNLLFSVLVSITGHKNIFLKDHIYGAQTGRDGLIRREREGDREFHSGLRQSNDL